MFFVATNQREVRAFNWQVKWTAQFLNVGARVGVGVNRFAPDNAPLRCALPGEGFGLA